jgi:hypothetical protein
MTTARLTPMCQQDSIDSLYTPSREPPSSLFQERLAAVHQHIDVSAIRRFTPDHGAGVAPLVLPPFRNIRVD